MPPPCFLLSRIPKPSLQLGRRSPKSWAMSYSNSRSSRYLPLCHQKALNTEAKKKNTEAKSQVRTQCQCTWLLGDGTRTLLCGICKTRVICGQSQTSKKTNKLVTASHRHYDFGGKKKPPPCAVRGICSSSFRNITFDTVLALG